MKSPSSAPCSCGSARYVRTAASASSRAGAGSTVSACSTPSSGRLRVTTSSAAASPPAGPEMATSSGAPENQGQPEKVPFSGGGGGGAGASAVESHAVCVKETEPPANWTSCAPLFVVVRWFCVVTNTQGWRAGAHLFTAPLLEGEGATTCATDTQAKKAGGSQQRRSIATSLASSQSSTFRGQVRTSLRRHCRRERGPQLARRTQSRRKQVRTSLRRHCRRERGPQVAQQTHMHIR